MTCKRFNNVSIKTRPALLALFLSIVGLMFVGCTEPVPREHFYLSGSTMGTQYHITLVSPLAAADEGDAEVKNLEQSGKKEDRKTQLQTDVNQLLSDFNNIVSTYIDSSELMQLNRANINHPITLSAELFSILQLSKNIHQASAGSFDVTVGPLVNLWGFGPHKNTLDRVPDDAELKNILQQVGQGYLELQADTQTIIKKAEVFIDLSAIAKGRGADLLAEYFDAQGFTDYLIEVGGEIRLRGFSPKQQKWRIAIERPSLLHGQAQQTLLLNNVAIATSGDYRNYFEEDGVRYSHTINPKTGRPVRHKLVSVTVITDTAAKADAWATALSVLGPDLALEFADKNGLAVFFIIKTATGFESIYSQSFTAYLEVGS